MVSESVPRDDLETPQTERMMIAIDHEFPDSLQDILYYISGFIVMSWPENQGILFFYISETLQMNRISFMASLLNAVL